jgi:hypothetical protein
MEKFVTLVTLPQGPEGSGKSLLQVIDEAIESQGGSLDCADYTEGRFQLVVHSTFQSGEKAIIAWASTRRYGWLPETSPAISLDAHERMQGSARQVAQSRR